MLADFGIALAVKEAGGNRLTETGLSLGTPQYMSPEQATGDRHLDARSDVYSLAAVLYEMLAGEPPVTGPNAQAMIAKLMTERPVHLRVVRGSVPDDIDAAVAKALDKTPADRFASRRRLRPRARAQADHRHRPDRRRSPRRRRPAKSKRGLLDRRRRRCILAASARRVRREGKAGSRARRAFALRDRTQLTFTGNVYASAISADGKQLAYITHNCGATGCTYAVEVQDVGGTATHRILDGVRPRYGLEWSPDRRNLIFVGTMAGSLGLLPPLGARRHAALPGLRRRDVLGRR